MFSNTGVMYMKEEIVDFFINLYTATEVKIWAVAGVMWSAFSYLVGGIDDPITALICLVIADFATGIVAAYRTNSWDSKHGFKGMCKKTTMFAVVAFLHWLDVAMQTHMLRGMAISGFAIIEAMSILENVDRCGWGWIIPDFIRGRLAQIKEERKI